VPGFPGSEPAPDPAPRLGVDCVRAVRFHTADSVAAGVAACRLISSNGTPFSFNLVLRRPLFSIKNVGEVTSFLALDYGSLILNLNRENSRLFPIFSASSEVSSTGCFSRGWTVLSAPIRG
jgi:hypothetical protein